MRWLAVSITAMAVWTAAAAGAQARTGLEEPLGVDGAGAPASAVHASARRAAPEPILEAERPGAAPREERVAREEPEADRAMACMGREACVRRRSGATADAIPDRALMRQRAIL
ncbi:MAG: hypothetical protein GC206_15565 [Alphaproteobacteria bacterium]|nr:hypothetical protein [Alphaproteobacteria bacterium]